MAASTTEQTRDIEAEYQAASDAVALGVGRVSIAWNAMQEAFGHLFGTVCNTDDAIGRAVWLSTDNDRTQRYMLEAAVKAAPASRWPDDATRAKEDFIWLLDAANKLADRRNNAVHAPYEVGVDVYATADFGTIEMKAVMLPASRGGHPRAKKLKDKDIMAELAWYAATAETLRAFADEATVCMFNWNRKGKRPAWPQRPRLPSLGQGRSHGESRPQTPAK